MRFIDLADKMEECRECEKDCPAHEALSVDNLFVRYAAFALCIVEGNNGCNIGGRDE